MALTDKQQQFYDLLRRYVDQHGQAPTLTECKAWLEAHEWGEIRSLNTVTQYLEALEATGKIRRLGRKRGIEFADTTATVAIPVLPNPVSCGAPTNVIEETAEEHHTISRKLVSDPARTYLFRAVGDSMNRAGIDEGDFVLVEATSNVRDGDIVLASINGCGTLKKLRRSATTITLLPDSTNPTHQPIYLHESDDFVIGGRVVHILKN